MPDASRRTASGALAPDAPRAATPPLRELSAPRPWPADVVDFLHELGGPAWIRVPGRDRSRARVVATLLHGNEPSGVRALHGWLRDGATPAVDAWLLVGAVDAALAPPTFSHRVLFGRRDLNRCFLPPFEGRDGELARAVLERLEAIAPEALVDVHNTTGHTPAYGVGPGMDAPRLALAACFARRYVHSDLRLGALIEAVQDRLPAVVVECGMAGDPASDRVAREGIERFLAADRLPSDAADRDPLTVVESPVRVCLQPGLAIRYGDARASDADLTVMASIDRHNFEALEPGAPLGWVRDAAPWPFVATRADGAEVSRELFRIRDGVVEARRAFVPIMMTTDPEIAVQDCIFYAARPRAS